MAPCTNRMLKKVASGVLATLRGSTYRSQRSDTLRGLSVRQELCKGRTGRTKGGVYLLTSMLAVALLDGLFEHPARRADRVFRKPACREPLHVRRLRERHAHARRHSDWLHRRFIVRTGKAVGFPEPDGTQEGTKIVFANRTSGLWPGPRSRHRLLFVETFPWCLLSPLVRNQRHHRSRPDSQLHWTHA